MVFRRSFFLLLSLFIIASSFGSLCVCADETAETSTIIVDAVSKENPPPSTVNTVVVRNVDSGRNIFNNSKGKVIQPGVAAKLMTALVAYESIGQSSAKVVIPAEAEKDGYIGAVGQVSAPRLGLKSGSILSARDLIQAVLVCSANDACVSLAVYVSGSPESFVKLMNQRAEELGCENTHFSNCTGLNSATSHTTAEDIALIAEAVFLKNELVTLASEPKATVGESKIHSKNYLTSTSLISNYYMKEAKGLIAGQTENESGYCLISSAEKDGLSYVFVVAEASAEKRTIAEDGSSTRYFEPGNAYDDMKAFIPWATESFSYHSVITRKNFSEELPVSAGKESDYVLVVAKDNIELLLPAGTDVETDLEKQVVFTEERLNAPVFEGQVVGTVSVLLDGELLASTELVAKTSVTENTFQTFGQKVFAFLESETMKTVLLWACILVGAYMLFNVGAFVYRLIKKYINASKD